MDYFHEIYTQCYDSGIVFPILRDVYCTIFGLANYVLKGYLSSETMSPIEAVSRLLLNAILGSFLILLFVLFVCYLVEAWLWYTRKILPKMVLPPKEKDKNI